jgi:hypothetical protein
VRLPRAASPTATPTEVPLPTEEPLAAQACSLAEALDGQHPHEIASGADGARALAIAERAAERIRAHAAASGIWQPVLPAAGAEKL